MTTTLFSDEVQLCGWSESHNSGAKVTFWLSDPAQLSAFRGMTERKGKTAGQRLAMVLVEIADDETPVEQPERIPPPKEKMGPLCQLAVKWCADDKFIEWFGLFYCLGVDKTDIGEMFKQVLEIDSRKSLDIDERASSRFQTLIRGPYMKYLESQ